MKISLQLRIIKRCFTLKAFLLRTWFFCLKKLHQLAAMMTIYLEQSCKLRDLGSESIHIHCIWFHWQHFFFVILRTQSVGNILGFIITCETEMTSHVTKHSVLKPVGRREALACQHLISTWSFTAGWGLAAAVPLNEVNACQLIRCPTWLAPHLHAVSDSWGNLTMWLLICCY